MDSPLYARLRDKYRIGDHYIAAYFKYIFGSDDIDEERFAREVASNPNLQNWADYAFSTNMRGRAFAGLLQQQLPKDGRRYLDVGSAYGGFLIGFMELGYEVAGIEYSVDLVHLSRANFKDYGLKDASVKGDILDEKLLSQLGRFDAITCIDVIEHVDDVPAAMKNMTGLLNPGGILVLQMPNKDSISNIMADSHFGIFGITLLGHSDARRFFYCHFPPDNPYDVGEYYRQGYYLKLLEGLGCSPSVMPPAVPTSLRGKAALIPQYFRRLGGFIFRNKTRLPLDLKFKVAVRAFFHILEFMFGLGLAVLFPKKFGPLVKQKFADDAWFIIGTKHP
jgi:SAM-dependent methyltransferase